MANKIEVCKETFSSKVLLGATIKELQEEFGISKSTVMARKKEWDLLGKSPNSLKRDPEPGTKICKGCGLELPLDSFPSNGYTPKGTKKYRSKCGSCTTKERKSIKISKILEILNKNNKKLECIKCGYNKNYAALCFHHLDPSTKEFSISEASNLSQEKLEIEINKCDVLCHNCHMEEHYPHLIV